MSGTRRYASNPADLPRETLVNLFFAAIEQYQKADALRYRAEEGWRSISHAEVLERVRRLSLLLESIGIVRGDRVAILSENRLEWAIADFACLCSGVIDVAVYATLPAAQVQYILEDSGARAIFVSGADQLAKIREIRGSLPQLETVISFDQVDGAEHLSLEEAYARGHEIETKGGGNGFKQRATAAQPDDVATLLYTSGTTGQPKGVMLTHNNIASNTIAASLLLKPGTDDVVLSFLPISHIFERMVDYWLFFSGATLAYEGSLDRVAKSLAEVQPTVAAGAPRVYEKFYARILSAKGIKRKLVFWARRIGLQWAEIRLAGREPPLAVRMQHALADRLVFRKVRQALGGRIKYFISGSAPLSPEIASFFYAAGVTILEGYGLTETSPVTNVNLPGGMRIGTVGPPIPGTEIAIAEDGEILVRGPQVMKGYYNRPEATAQVIDADGWFHTGDIGEIDQDGYLRITDRKKDLIVTAGGKNIAPQPIENLVKLSRFVSEAVMVGDRKPYPVVLVVPNFETLEAWARTQGIPTDDRAALIADPRVHARVEEDVMRKLSALARFEQPKKIALLPREFSIERGELTPSMKVKRKIVQEHYADVLESLYGDAVEAA
jgi:long-chain acyl-CoA synthetase